MKINSIERWWFSLKWLPYRLKLSVVSMAKLLYFSPKYLFIALVVSVLFYEVVYWFLNIGLAQYLFTTPYLSIVDKLEILVGSYASVFQVPISKLPVLLFATSIFQGITVAGLVYLLTASRSRDKSFMRQVGSTGVAGALSVVGVGCAACGTSIILPIITLLVGSVSTQFVDTIGLYALLAALLVSIFGSYLIGLKVAYIRT